MLINLTLVIQAFNFYLAYLLIDRILLRYVVLFTQNERKSEQNLMRDVASIKENLKQLEQEKKTQQECILLSFKETTPENIFEYKSIEHPSSMLNNQPIVQSEIDRQESIKQLKDNLYLNLGSVH